MNRKLIATAGFVVVVGGVLALFIALSMLGTHPPDMPSSTPQHVLRFNLKNDLIGLESDPPIDLTAASAQPGFQYDKKAVEEHINTQCAACHATCNEPLEGTPTTPLESRGAGDLTHRCRGEHHPPKTECIKCHRMAPHAETRN
jgi:hypothetical protein